MSEENGICESCGEFCSPVPVDCGIGPYEYWGATGIHKDIQMLSPCCEAEVVDGGNTLIGTTYHTARKDHADGKVKKGDYYSVSVYRYWRKDGPSWIRNFKKVIQKSRQLELHSAPLDGE